MRRVGGVALSLFLLFLGGRETGSTTVEPRPCSCPVCERTFVTMGFSSYSFMGQRSRDLSHHEAFVFNGVETCPFCLYSGLENDFGKLRPGEQAKLREILKNPEAQLRGQVEELQKAGARDAPKIVSAAPALFLARACYRVRKADAARELYLKRLLHAQTKGENGRAHSVAIQMLLDELRAQLRGELPANDKVVFTYLIGELERQRGDAEAARTWLRQARALAERETKESKKEIKREKEGEDGPELVPRRVESVVAELENERKSARWVMEWVDEQLLRMEFESKASGELIGELNRDGARKNLAAAVLVERDDLETWRLIFAWLRQSPEAFEWLKRQSLLSEKKIRVCPELWAWVNKLHLESLRDGGWGYGALVGDDYKPTDEHTRLLKAALPELLKGGIFREHVVAAGETLKGIAAQNLTDERFITAVNADVADPLRVGSKLKLLKCPRDWPEDRVHRNLKALIAKGDEQAADFFVSWLAELTPDVDNYVLRYAAGDGIAALAKTPALHARVRASGKEPTNALVRDGVAYVLGDDKSGERLLQVAADAERGEQRETALSYIAGRSPRLALEATLKEIGKEPGYSFLSQLRVLMEREATAEDIARVETFAATLPVSAEKDAVRDNARLWVRSSTDLAIGDRKLKMLGKALGAGEAQIGKDQK